MNTKIIAATILWWRFTWRSIVALLVLLAPWVVMSVIGLQFQIPWLVDAPRRYTPWTMYLMLGAYVWIIRGHLFFPGVLSRMRFAIALRSGPASRWFGEPGQTGEGRLPWGFVAAFLVDFGLRMVVLTALLQLVPSTWSTPFSPEQASAISLALSFVLQYLVFVSIAYAGGLVEFRAASATPGRRMAA